MTYYYVHTHDSGPGGQSYGTVNSTPNSQFPKPGQHQQGFVQPPTAASMPLPGGSRVQGQGEEEVPPTYQQAMGDNKVQKP